MSNFWKLLPKPFLVLAPMDDVTDVVFREIMTELARPDVFFTEFTSAGGLCSKGREAVIRRLKYSKNQRPIVAQIWGKDIGYMREAAKLVKELGFDGIDINMGCPDRGVMKKGAGAGHIGNYNHTGQVISAVKEGAQGIPVSIKTRLGQDNNIANEWISFLLEQSVNALIVHGRIASQMSRGEANWNEIKRAVDIRNKISPDTLVIGNGDVKGYRQAIEKYETYGVDGIMIGTGIFSNPWVFEKTLEPATHDNKSYIQILLKHVDLFEATWGDTKNFQIMKKFFKMYIKDFDGANQLRQQLMECKTSVQVRKILKPFSAIR